MSRFRSGSRARAAHGLLKLLFDQNLSLKLCRKLADLFPHSSQVRLLGLDRADDKILWDEARKGDYILVTQDADFAKSGSAKWSSSQSCLVTLRQSADASH